MSASTEVCNTLYHPHVHVSSEQWVTLSLPSKPKPTPVKAWWNLQPGPSCHRHLQHMELPDFGVTSRQTHPPHSPWVKHSQILWFQCQSFADKGHRVRILKQFPSIDFLSALPPMPCFKKSLLSIPGAWHNSFRKLSSVWIGVQPCGAETNDSYKELIKWQKKIPVFSAVKCFSALLQNVTQGGFSTLYHFRGDRAVPSGLLLLEWEVGWRQSCGKCPNGQLNRTA